MVHGDIKGQNLLVSDEGIIKITDFGDSLLLDSSPKFSTLRKQNTVALNWAAPELLIDADTVRTLESDIYSLGMTMLEIFTDEPPYGRSTTPAAIIVVLLSTHQRPSRPKPLEFGVKQNKIWELIVRCWAEDPKGRPDALSVLKSLKSFVN
ncbi:kinase-like protein [Ceratobasidium sp. AG-I]|nr:kinase-like protein [Ceratobasidium sp. AG-I]